MSEKHLWNAAGELLEAFLKMHHNALVSIVTANAEKIAPLFATHAAKDFERYLAQIQGEEAEPRCVALRKIVIVVENMRQSAIEDGHSKPAFFEGLDQIQRHAEAALEKEVPGE